MRKTAVCVARRVRSPAAFARMGLASARALSPAYAITLVSILKTTRKTAAFAAMLVPAASRARAVCAHVLRTRRPYAEANVSIPIAMGNIAEAVTTHAPRESIASAVLVLVRAPRLPRATANVWTPQVISPIVALAAMDVRQEKFVPPAVVNVSRAKAVGGFVLRPDVLARSTLPTDMDTLVRCFPTGKWCVGVEIPMASWGMELLLRAAPRYSFPT